MSREEFWASTWRELYDEIEAARLRDTDAFNRDTVLAWRIVNIWVQARSKRRMPALRPMLRQSPVMQQRRPSYNAQLAVLHVLSEQYGIPLQHGVLH